MAETQLAQIQVRRDTAANWTSEDPTLAEGEYGLDTTTGQIKIGDGVTAWTSLYSPTQFCTAWVSFNGTGTPIINDSFNVISITDNGSGLFTLNIENELENTNYSVIISTSDSTANTTNINCFVDRLVSPSTTSVKIATTYKPGGS